MSMMVMQKAEADKLTAQPEANVPQRQTLPIEHPISTAKVGEVHTHPLHQQPYVKTPVDWRNIGSAQSKAQSSTIAPSNFTHGEFEYDQGRMPGQSVKVRKAPYEMSPEEFGQHFTTQGKDLNFDVAHHAAGDWAKPEEVDTSLWHATTNMPAIHKEGFRSVGHSALGGAHYGETSITYNEDAAHAIADQLKEVSHIVKGNIGSQDTMDLAYNRMVGDLEHYGIYDEEGTTLDPLYHLQDVAEKYVLSGKNPNIALGDKLSGHQFEDENELMETVAPYLNTPKERYEFYRDALQSWSRTMGRQESEWESTEPRPHNDMVVVSDWDDIKHLDPDKIGVVPVSVRRGAKVVHNPGEEEISTAHHNVLVGDYDYHKKNARKQGWM